MNTKWLTFFLFLSCALHSLANLKPNEINAQLFIAENQPTEILILFSLNTLKNKFNLPYLQENTLNKKQLDQLKIDTLALANNFLNLSQNGQNLPKFVKEVLISSSNPNSSDTLTTNDINLAVSILFSHPFPLKNFSLNWQFFPTETQVINLNIVDKELKNFEISSSSPTITWENNSPVSPLPKPLLLSEKIPQLSQFQGTFLFLGAVFLLLTILWILLPPKFLKKTIIIPVVLLTFILSFSLDLTFSKVSTISAIPKEQEKLKKITEYLLAQTYSAVSAESPNTLMLRLQESTTKNFLDNTFSQIYQTKALQPNINLMFGKVTIKEIAPVNFQQLQCIWQIEGYIQHNSHNHTRNLQYNGLLTLNYQNDQWQITDAKITPLHKDSPAK